MIVRVDREVPVGQASDRSAWNRYASSPVVFKCVVLVGLFGLIIALQAASGAFRSEFSAYPDEPAHYVTSLMLREYITGPNPIWPLRFAENYYAHYPKVAFGHWPPVFYIVQSLWMLLFSASSVSVRLEIAFTTAVLAYSVWSEGRRWFTTQAALLAAALLVCLPLVQESTDQEMAESLLVLFCFWSVVYFGRYLESGKRSDSLWFGIYFSLAVLTKGSGWLLAIVPPIAMLLTRKLRLLLRASFWQGVLLIAILCLPWQLLTLQSAERGWPGGSHPSLSYTFGSLAQFFDILVAIMGPILSVLVAIGVIVAIAIPMFSRPVTSVPAVMFALLVGDWVFHSVVPAGVEDRKMIMAVPALLFFLFTGGIWIADRLPLRGRLSRWRRNFVALAGASVFAAQGFAIPRDRHYGYREAANFILSNPELRHGTILVSSEAGGEGLLISEVAMREPRPQDVIIRATKALAKVDWTGADYHSLFTNPLELLRYLDERHVSVLVIDTYPPQVLFSHQQLIERMIRLNPGRFRLLAAFSDRATARSGEVEVYQVHSP